MAVLGVLTCEILELEFAHLLGTDSEVGRVTVLEDLELITVTPEIRAERNVRSEVGALVAGISPELNRILAVRTGDDLMMVNQARISPAEEANQAVRAVAGRGRVRIYAERNGQVLVHTFNWGR